MKRRIHAIAGAIALLTVTLFWSATLISELLLGAEAIVAVKRGILYGMAVLIPAVMLAGGTGFALSAGRSGCVITTKKRRMPLIALNGLLILAPSAVFLYLKAAAGEFDTAFFTVQALELLAGATQCLLLALNARDGLQLRGRRRERPDAAAG